MKVKNEKKEGCSMKILIKGAGDLATGIASRLYRAGHQIIMTEIAVPLTVRRTVALSRAVYEEKAQVEDMTGVLVKDMESAERVLLDGDIPVIVDPKASVKDEFHPDVIVDAILAKRNIGTRITDAPFVIGVGPGFTAGEDCHCVIETKRGHTLGETIYKGAAIPNTGVPGEVGGFSTERIIRGAAKGNMVPVAKIGDVVEKGQVVALTGGKEVYAKMSGIVRGMLQPDVIVHENMKIGDIDARSEPFHCYTISDKARAIGGAVLEAITRFEHMRGNYAFVVLAAGAGSRFGENKLLAKVDGKPLYQHTLNRMKAFGAYPQVIVTGYEEIMEMAKAQGMEVVENDHPEFGISHSIKLGIESCVKNYPQIEGILFSVCDQPNLECATIQRILNTASLHKGQIIRVADGEHYGNPVLWDQKFFPELMKLQGDQGGRTLMKQMPEKIRNVGVAPEELKDIDFKSDLGLNR